ncbi:MAG TPA: tetratricopeptide repeat protein, partial [Chloroflexota bacterium]|nr:tetratricopeptide repeat protein [Chloroflexota bacterium]
ALAGAGEPALSFLRTDGDQVHLYPGGEVWTDVGAFEAAAAEARRKRESQAYARAVGLYAGELLPEDPYEDWAAGRREELRRLYLSLLLEQAEVAQEAGDGEGEDAALTRAITADPAHEAAHQGLMRLHARSGQRHLALRQFQQLRESLRRELDAEPDPASQRLYEDILSGAYPGTDSLVSAAPGADATDADATDADAPPADTPRQPVCGGERGARRGPGSQAPASVPGRRHNLPTPMTSFVGRETEVSEVRRLLLGASEAPKRRTSVRRASEGRPRLVTLTGSGGCGKTRLALQVAGSLVGPDGGGPDGAPGGAPDTALYPDGVWLVELAPVADPSLVGQAVATALNVREVPGQAVSQTLAGALAERRLLLVLDNCEHVLDACASLADTLLRSGPGLQLLATSQQALGMAGEVAYRVPSLATPEEDVLGGAGEGPEVVAVLEAMQGFGAVRLFVERARFGQPGFTLSPQNARDVLTVCRRLDGIPLAIELAAARVAVLSPRQLAERLDDRFRLLTRGNRAAPARQQTLRTLVDWSYGLLTPEERSLFDRLAVFAGGFTLEAAEAVCAGEGLDQTDVLPLLSLLVEKSLVNAGEEEDARVRFRLPETLREYARERLDGAPAPGATRGRHAWFYTALAEEAHPALAGPAQGAWLDRLEREHDNLRAALRWHLDGGDARGALRLGAALGRFWAMRGYLSEGRVRLAEALAIPDGGASEAPAVTGEGAPGAPAGLDRARALYNAGFLAWRQGDAAAARPLLEASVSLARSLGDLGTTAYGLFYLGLVPEFQGDYPAARAYFEESRTLFEEAGDQHGLALALFGLGNVARQEGDLAPARALLERSLDLFREAGDRRSLALPLGYLGRVALRLGDPAEARARLEGALAIWEEIGEQWLVASVLDNLAEVARVEGDQTEAEALLDRSLTLWRALGSTGPQTQSALHQLGHVNLTLDRPEQAAALFRESLTRAREQGNKRHMAEALAGLAGVAAVAGDGELAGRRFGAAEALRQAVGAALSPADAIDHRRAERTARAAVGSSTYSAARRAGENAELDSIMDEALRGSPAGVGT